jgi:hypothetical protein
MGCSSDGARRAADTIYRRVAAVDSLDLSTGPLAKDLAPAGAGTPTPTNLGLQPADGGTVVISFAFVGAADAVDVSIVNWGRDKTGTLVPLSVRDLAQVTAGPFFDADGAFLGAELVEPVNATMYEVRVRAVAGTVDKIRTWSY